MHHTEHSDRFSLASLDGGATTTTIMSSFGEYRHIRDIGAVADFVRFFLNVCKERSSEKIDAF